MDVHVRPTDLRSYAGMLERNAAYPDTIWRYADGNTELSASTGGLLNLVCGGHDRVRDTLHSMCIDLRQLLHGSGRKLDTAAGWYDRADQAARERVDSLNMDLPRESESSSAPRRTCGRYSDVADPRHRLNGPTGTEVQDPSELIATVLDRCRTSAWASTVVEAITGRDILGDLGREFLGDWEAWSRAGRVWEQIGQAMADLASNVEHGNAEMDGGWDGQAADAAYQYFAGFASQIAAQQETFAALKAGYEFYSAFAYTTASVLADLVRELFDALPAATVDGPADEVTGALQAPGVIRICNRISQLLTAAHATAGAINALIIHRSRMLYEIREALPLQSYDLKGL